MFRILRFPPSRLSRIALSFLVIAGALLSFGMAEASNWSSTVLVRTESFETIDDGNAATDLELRFGDILGEKLYWDRAQSRFRLTDDLSVQGSLSGSSLRIDGLAEVHGALSASGAVRTDSGMTLNDDRDTNNVPITFGSSGADESIVWEDTPDLFRFSDDISVRGSFSGSTLHTDRTFSASGASSFDGTTSFRDIAYIWPGTVAGSSGHVLKVDPATGQLSWSADQTGGGAAPPSVNSGGVLTITDKRFVDQDGDTMTGNLIIRSTSGVTAINLNVIGGMSGYFMRLSGPAEVHGALTASGAIRSDSDLTINDDQTSATDAVLTFGASGGNETLTWQEVQDRFTFSDDVTTTGGLSASGAVSFDSTAAFNNVNYTWPGSAAASSGNVLKVNPATGQLSWSADQTGSANVPPLVNSGGVITIGGKRYVDQSGDTMTGTLIIRSTSGTTAIGLEVAGTISGRSLVVSGTNGAYLLSASGATNRVGIKRNNGGPKADFEVVGAMSGSRLFVATSMSGAGLTDCDGSGSVLQWDATTQRFSCRQNIPDVVRYSSGSSASPGATQSLVWEDSNTKRIVSNKGVVPSITPTATTQQILVTLSISIQAGSTDDEMDAGYVYRNIGSAPTCGTVSQIVGPMLTTPFTTTAIAESGSMVTAFVDTPATTSAVFYTVCTSVKSFGTFTTTSPNKVTQVEMSLIVVGADLAENYYTSDSSIEPGHVVSIDTSVPVGGVRKSGRPYDPEVLGIISTHPWHTLDDGIGRTWGRAVPVALSGRVPVKVSLENGPIVAGDYLTASSVPGIAMKAMKPGHVIGQALIPYDGYDGNVGTVLVFVKNAYRGEGAEDDRRQALEERVRALEEKLRSKEEELHFLDGSGGP